MCGTPEYLAPEIIQSKGHGKAVDWWALGILIYEMLAGYPPFYDENPFGIYQKILAGKLEFPRHFETHARDLIRKLLTADRTKRIGARAPRTSPRRAPTPPPPAAPPCLTPPPPPPPPHRPAGNLKNGAEDIKKHKWYRGLNWAALYNKQMDAYIVPECRSADDTSQYDTYADSVEESGPLLNASKDMELFGQF